MVPPRKRVLECLLFLVRPQSPNLDWSLELLFFSRVNLAGKRAAGRKRLDMERPSRKYTYRRLGQSTRTKSRVLS
jgi:hypothetical protein